jgi:uncharacterized protein YjaZ|tara:strand:+ start:9559 stop:9795 length:237 start_codon:yes stop_codon:yes gene_type:complete
MRLDFKTSGSNERGIYYGETERIIVFLNWHESLDDVFKTITHEVIHFCLDHYEMVDPIDEDQEERLIFQMAWAMESLI